jgi:hypothetical protein
MNHAVPRYGWIMDDVCAVSMSHLCRYRLYVEDEAVWLGGSSNTYLVGNSLGNLGIYE